MDPNNSEFRRFLRAPTKVVVPALIILIWFFWFAGGGIFADFTPDDMMNLEYYWEQGIARTLLAAAQVITTFFRPMGGVVYLAIFSVFGLQPLPFRIACFAILFVNLALFFRFFNLLSQKRDLAWIGVFLCSYHGWFTDLYYSTGTIYELLCVCFYLLAFNMYLGVRTAGRFPGGRRLLAIVVCYASALDSKELAVSLPLFLGLYELLYHPPRSIKGIAGWLNNQGRVAVITGLLTAPYVWVKMTGGQIAVNPSYRPRISANVFLDTFHLYLNPLFYQDHFLRDPNTIQLMLALLGISMISRRRDLILAWFFILLSVLPFVFIPHYAAFFMYLPALGWALMAAGLLLMIRDGLLKGLGVLLGRSLLTQRAPRTVVLLLLMIPVAALLAVVQSRESAKTLEQFRQARFPISPLVEQLQQNLPLITPGKIVWFRSDPFPQDSYVAQQTTRLVYRIRDLVVTRGGEKPPGDVIVLDYDGKTLRISS